MKTLQQYKEVVKKNDGKTFWDLEDERYKEDPTNQLYQSAERLAKVKADKFYEVVRDPMAPEHAETLKTYVEAFAQDFNEVYAFFLRKMCKDLDARPYQFRNLAYETNYFRRYCPFTKEDAMFIDQFKELMHAKWSAEGYDGSDMMAAEFFSTHPISAESRRAMSQVATVAEKAHVVNRIF